MEYIKDVFITENKRYLNSAMYLSDYLCVIGCILVMDCSVDYSIRDFFLKDPITPPERWPSSASTTSSLGGAFEKITKVISYKNIAIPELNDPFFQQSQMKEGCNKNMAAHFDPSWVSVID